eukprot:139903-Pleurochrysis_carterae.AAC.1
MTPEFHPSERCGGCGQPMRWRPRGRPASHDCEYCKKPVHTSSSCSGEFLPRSNHASVHISSAFMP